MHHQKIIVIDRLRACPPSSRSSARVTFCAAPTINCRPTSVERVEGDLSDPVADSPASPFAADVFQRGHTRSETRRREASPRRNTRRTEAHTAASVPRALSTTVQPAASAGAIFRTVATAPTAEIPRQRSLRQTPTGLLMTRFYRLPRSPGEESIGHTPGDTLPFQLNQPQMIHRDAALPRRSAPAACRSPSSSCARFQCCDD